MTREAELLAVDALASEMGQATAAHAAELACANCGHLLYGRYCSHCGQSTDLRHRSVLHLLWEAFEGLFHLDGRLWRTLPALFFRPGSLGRDYLEGRVARHVPPFRMFLVALVIFVFAAEQAMNRIQESPHGIGKFTVDGQVVQGRTEAIAKMRANAASRYALQMRQATQARDLALKDPKANGGGEAVYQSAVQEAAKKRDAELHEAADLAALDNGNATFARGLAAATERPEYYITVLFQWAHRLAVLLLPIVAAFLTLSYANRRTFFIYDHLIVAMNFLSFLFLAYALAFLLPEPVQSYAVILVLLWSPVNLFMTLRGAYGSGAIGAAVRAIAISLATAACFLALLVGLLFLTFYQL
jgi:hypothetical protein